MTTHEGFPFVYLHDLCGKPAFYLNHLPNRHELVTAEDVIGLDGEKLLSGSEIVCGSCDASIPCLHSADICLAT